MVRAAAKNYTDVTVITNSDQYNELIDELNKYKGATSLQFKEKMFRRLWRDEVETIAVGWWMKVPQGMTEQEVVDKITKVCDRIAHKYTFYGYTIDDIKQDSTVKIKFETREKKRKFIKEEIKRHGGKNNL